MFKLPHFRLLCSYVIPLKKRGPKFRASSETRAETTTRFSAGDRDKSLVDASSWQTGATSSTSPGTAVDSNTALSHPFHVSEEPEGGQQSQESQITLRPRFIGVYEGLISSINEVLPQLHIDKIVRDRLGLYMQYLFPIIPLVHEAGLIAASTRPHISQAVDSILGRNTFSG